MPGALNAEMKRCTNATCSREPRKPVWMASKRRFSFRHSAMYSSRCGVLSVHAKESKPVWLVKKAVGTGQHWTFIAERMGIVTASEQRPKLVKSLITADFF